MQTSTHRTTKHHVRLQTDGSTRVARTKHINKPIQATTQPCPNTSTQQQKNTTTWHKY
jgi:hypothetical protein